jgi:hypothetical protein
MIRVLALLVVLALGGCSDKGDWAVVAAPDYHPGDGPARPAAWRINARTGVLQFCFLDYRGEPACTGPAIDEKADEKTLLPNSN